MTLYGIDAASFQGDVSWGPVDASCAFGWEKVTQGTGYINPRWAPERGEMSARADATGFIPGAYLFLEQGNGAGQAEFFHKAAGSLAGFALAVDIEPSTTRPDMATARACVTRLRALYPGKPIGGYIPHWYWGSQDTTFVSYLWASNYVTGTGTPSGLYAKVQPAQWAGYGGQNVDLLQYTSQAVVPGVTGPCDCSAYRGDAVQLRHLLLGVPAPVRPAHPVKLAADGQHTFRQLVHARGTTVNRALWLMSQDPDKVRKGGWGKLQAAFLARDDFDKIPPKGMVYWVG